MAGSFPTSVTSYTNPPAGDFTATAVGARTHSGFHGDVNDDLEQVMTKLGIGASVPAADTVLRGTGAGTSAFGALATGDIAANAITQGALAEGATSGPSNGTSTPIALAHMSVTLTTVGGTCYGVFSGTFAHTTVGSQMVLDFMVDGGFAGRREITCKVANASENITMIFWATPAAGSHTFSINFWTSGAGTVTAVGTQRSLLMIEFKR